MDKLATLQQRLQEAEDKKVALQDQVRVTPGHLRRREIPFFLSQYMGHRDASIDKNRIETTCFAIYQEIVTTATDDTQVTDCGNKLRRAEQLISGLGGEKTSWARFSAELRSRYENVTGNCAKLLQVLLGSCRCVLLPYERTRVMRSGIARR